MAKKDNPVPSLNKIEKEIIEFLDTNSQMFQKHQYHYLKMCKEGIHSIFEKNILKNGVETNKEQPKDYPCPLCGNSRNCDDACMT